MLKGFDFSDGNGLTVAQARAAGMQFVCRYLSGGSAKDITRAELGNWTGADIPVVFVWETTGTDMTSIAAGRADAQGAQAELDRLGASEAVVFFAADEAQEPDLPGYFSGVLEVMPRSRVGVYGGLGSVRAAFDAGLVSYGWQTLAWSGTPTVWDDRALLRQTGSGKIGPADVDFDEAAYWNSTKVLELSDDFGQWPRPRVAHKRWQEWSTAGDLSLAAFAAKLDVGVATLLENTIKHYGYLNGPLGNYIRGLAEGTVKPADPMPRGCKFWVYA